MICDIKHQIIVLFYDLLFNQYKILKLFTIFPGKYFNIVLFIDP